MKRKLAVGALCMITIITVYIFAFSANSHIYVNCVKLLFHPDEIYYITDITVEDLIAYADVISAEDVVRVEMISKRDNNEQALREHMQELGFTLLEVQTYEGSDELYKQLFGKDDQLLIIDRRFFKDRYVIYFTLVTNFVSWEEWYLTKSQYE